MTGPDAGWTEFAVLVAESGDLDPSRVSRASRIGADLGLDSLAILELVVALSREGTHRPLDELDLHDWNLLTAGELFDRANRPVTAG